MNLEQKTNKEDSAEVFEYFKRSPMFSAVTAVLKLGALAIFEEPGNLDLLGKCIVVSGVGDMFSMVYSGFRFFNTQPVEKILEDGNAIYPCSERHIFYDLPRYLYKKFK